MLSKQKNQDPTLGKIANRLCLVPAVQDATHRKSRPWWQAIPVLKESCNSKTRKKALVKLINYNHFRNWFCSKMSLHKARIVFCQSEK